MSSESRQVRLRRVIFCVTFFSTALPLLLYMLRYPTAAPICLFAGDSFYYLDIAKNSAGHAGFSFDGVHGTNGFHPLWEWLLTFCYSVRILQAKDLFRDLGIVYCLNLFFLAIGGAIFSVITSRFLRCWWLALGVVAPGYLWFLLGIGGSTLTSWSFLNGMESGLALFLIAAALFVALSFQVSLWRDISFSILLGLGVLARLDEIFLLFAFVIVAFWLEHLAPQRYAARFLPAVMMIAGYLLYNHHTIGVFLPTSGNVKAGIGLLDNAKSLLKQFLPVVTGDKPAMLPGSHAFYGFVAVYARTVQMVVPAAICSLELLRQMRRGSGVERPYLVSLSLGVVCKAAYNFLFVRGFYQGEWYYVVSFAVANLVLAIWLDRLLCTMSEKMRLSRPWLPRLAGVSYVLCVALTFNIFVSYRNYYSPINLFRLLRDGDSIRRGIRSAGYSRFLEFDDGGLAYALQLPSTAGFGLALDPEAIRALRQRSFFSLMARRDVRLVIAADAYGSQLESYLAGKDWEQGLAFNEIAAVEFQHFRPRLIGTDTEHGLFFFLLEPVVPTH